MDMTSLACPRLARSHKLIGGGARGVWTTLLCPSDVRRRARCTHRAARIAARLAEGEA